MFGKFLSKKTRETEIQKYANGFSLELLKAFLSKEFSNV